MYKRQIRVSITTLPGEQKQAFSFEAKNMKTTRPFFSVKINDKTEKILIVMRKKSFSQKDPIIATFEGTTICSRFDELIKSDCIEQVFEFFLNLKVKESMFEQFEKQDEPISLTFEGISISLMEDDSKALSPIFLSSEFSENLTVFNFLH